MSLHRSFCDPCMSRLQEEGKYRVTFLYHICFFTENSNQMCWDKASNFYTWAYNIHAIKFKCNNCIPNSRRSLIFLWISFISKSEFVRQLDRHFFLFTTGFMALGCKYILSYLNLPEKTTCTFRVDLWHMGYFIISPIFLLISIHSSLDTVTTSWRKLSLIYQEWATDLALMLFPSPSAPTT